MHERDQVAHGVLSAAENAKSLRRELAVMSRRDPSTIARPKSSRSSTRFATAFQATLPRAPARSRTSGQEFMGFWLGLRMLGIFPRT
jgi:hypothetical protein